MKCKTCNGLGRTKATEFVGVDEGLREVVILCPACGGTGKVVHPMMSMNGDEYTGEWEQHECEVCDGTGVVEPLTNEDWFCQLPSEEKVTALLDLRERIRQKMRAELGSENKFHKGDYYREWLKEKHNA